MDTSNQRAVLFDLDGTLTDPKPGITTCIRCALTEMGYEAPDADDLRWCIGPPLKGSFAKLLNTNDEAMLDRAIALYRERFSTVGLYENTLYAGIPDVLQELRAQTYRTYVVTSKPVVYALQIVEHFALIDLFHAVYGSELDGTRSDKGELIAYVLAREELLPPNVVMIGDREHDVLGARKHNVACIGVSYGYGSEEELKDNGAISIAQSPQDIPELIEAYFGSRDLL